MKRANMLQMKGTLVFLLAFCASMIFYLGKTSQLENYSDNVDSALYLYNNLVENNLQNFQSSRVVYLKRQKYLQNMCHNYSRKNSNIRSTDEKSYGEHFDHILVDEKHKLLYCYVPKVACTNWKRIFMILVGQANTSDATEIPASVAHRRGIFTYLSNYTATDIEHILQTYTKFLFVRHPFERILSAYRNKLEQHYLSSKYFQERFGRFIVKYFRQNPSDVSLRKGDDVTFKEFATYLTSPNNSFNEHWKPVYELCHPCFIHYDIIGKYETLYEDSDFILRQAGTREIVFPRALKPSSTSSNVKKYFSTLSSDLIRQLYDIYKPDFELFGYTLHSYT